MATFAVLGRQGASIVDCHLNLWCLPGILGRQPMYWDVGLRIRAGDELVTAFGLLLPFGTDGRALRDLSELVASRRTARLIFGRQVDIGDGYLVIDGTNVVLAHVETAISHRVDEDSATGFSRWEVQLAEGIQPGQEGYVRVRFEVRNRGRMWEWKRPLLLRNGALIDVRICDFRELVAVPNWLNHEKAITEIATLNLFVVMPAAYQLRLASPEARYVRLLEGAPWEEYMGRSVGVRRQRKLVIYAWRSEEPISARKRFRAFLDVTREPGWGWYPNLVVAAFITAIATWLLLDVPTRLADGLRLLIWVLAAIASAGVATALLSVIPFLRPARTWLARQWRSFDDFLHRPSGLR